MFWKLRRNGLEGELRELPRLLAGFFSHAAAQGGTALDEGALRRAFPREEAEWLLEQFGGEGKGNLRGAVEALFQLPPDRRRAIAEAVAHDMEFDRAADPERFFFTEPSLPGEERRIVKAFYRYFYETVFRRGQSGMVCGTDYKAYLEGHRRANQALKACPVCLRRMPGGQAENSLDHYFPRGTYPALSLHPANLLFICKECNETYKKSRDALKRGAKPLSRVFLPYQDTVRDHAAVTFRREKNTDRVHLLAVSGGRAESARVQNFDYLYQLEKRWSGEVEGIFEQTRKCCANRGFTREEVREKLRGICEDLRLLSDFPDRFVEAAYLEWLCGTMFDAFYDSL